MKKKKNGQFAWPRSKLMDVHFEEHHEAKKERGVESDFRAHPALIFQSSKSSANPRPVRTLFSCFLLETI